MTTAEFTALLILCTATSFTPGPNTTLSAALAANFGMAAAMRFVLAVVLGWGLLFSLCAGGLGVQVVGVGYLLWLALRLARSNSTAPSDTARLQVGFLQGVALQFLNIKAWMLALTVVAGWLAGRDDAAQRFAVLLAVVLAFGFFSNLLYALVGSLLRHWLAGPYRAGVATGVRLRWFNRAMAIVLVLTAYWMATL
jgi:threonine/homoserine/homoserine lactone efflux protein